MKKFGNVLVTGGAGFIGSNLVENLVGRAEQITVLDDLSTGSTKNLGKTLDQITFIESPCSKILDFDLNPDLIFHLSIPSSSPMYKDDNMLVGRSINGFIRLFDLARENGADVIYASTSSMYGSKDPPHREDMTFEPFDYYTEARLEMERLAEMYQKLYGANSIGMRFFSVYGPHEKAKQQYANIISQFCWKMMEDEAPVIYGDGTQTRDFTHVRDVVKACVLAAERADKVGHNAINVGTGVETTFNQVVEKLNFFLGKDIEPKYVENPIDNYVERTKADTTKAEDKLDFEATISVDEGIRRTVQYYDKKLD